MIKVNKEKMQVQIQEFAPNSTLISEIITWPTFPLPHQLFFLLFLNHKYPKRNGSQGKYFAKY